MVPEVGGNERTCLETHDTEEACRCLLEDKEKKIQSKKSFLSRFTHNFRFLKSWFWSLSSVYSMPVEENLIKTDGAGRCDQCLSNNQSCKSLPDFRDVEKNIYLRRNSSAVTCTFTNENVSTESLYGTFLNFSDLEPQDNILIQIQEVVATSPYYSRLIINEMVALRISRDIIELAEHEPCGLKGCKVILYVEDCGDKILLGEFDPKEEGFICTFEVNIVLNIRRRLLTSFIPFFACMPRTSYVSEKYEISKDKLYTCSNSRPSTPVHWQI